VATPRKYSLATPQGIRVRFHWLAPKESRSTLSHGPTGAIRRGSIRIEQQLSRRASLFEATSAFAAGVDQAVVTASDGC
jgi:hypothetical protein